MTTSDKMKKFASKKKSGSFGAKNVHKPDREVVTKLGSNFQRSAPVVASNSKAARQSGCALAHPLLHVISMYQSPVRLWSLAGFSAGLTETDFTLTDPRCTDMTRTVPAFE